MTLPSKQVYPEILEKICSRCGITKPFSCFYPLEKGRYGLHATCKTCMNEESSKYHKLGKRKKYPITIAITEKICKKCVQMLPIAAFSKDSQFRDGLSTICKQCEKAIRDKREIDTPGWKIAAYRRYQDSISPEKKKEISARSAFQKYGTTQEWFEQKLASQDGKCAICRTDSNQKAQRFHMDHDHSCCKKNRACLACLRDLLCIRCNFRLGAVEDIKWTAKAITYLIKHGKDVTPIRVALMPK